MIGLALALLAAAPASELEIVWAAPEGCPSTEEIELRVADLAGRPVRVGPRAAWSVRAEVRRDGALFVADVALTTRLGTEHRPLRAKQCDSLADAVAVIVALALDAPPPPAPAPLPTTETATEAPPRSRVVRPRPRQARRSSGWRSPWRAGLEAEASAHLGLPDPGVGAHLGLRARWGRLGLALGGGARRSGAVELAPGQQARVTVGGGYLRGCGLMWAVRPWTARGCLRAELGRARVDAEGRAQGARSVWWAQASAELAVGFEARGAWGAALRARVQVPIARPTAVISLSSGDVEAFRVPPVSLGLGLSVDRDFF